MQTLDWNWTTDEVTLRSYGPQLLSWLIHIENGIKVKYRACRVDQNHVLVEKVSFYGFVEAGEVVTNGNYLYALQLSEKVDPIEADRLEDQYQEKLERRNA